MNLQQVVCFLNMKTDLLFLFLQPDTSAACVVVPLHIDLFNDSCELANFS